MLIIFVFAPIVGSLPLMFFDYSVLGKTKFVGFDNFITAFHDRNFQAAIVNTVLFVVVVPVIQILSILLQCWSTGSCGASHCSARCITSRWSLPWWPISIMWGFLFDPSGLINTVLKNWGVISSSLDF